MVVITGASSGIGESLAIVLYAAGCRLILVSRRVEELERVKAALVSSTVVCVNFHCWFFNLQCNMLNFCATEIHVPTF